MKRVPSPVTFGLVSLTLIASTAALMSQSSAQTIGSSKDEVKVIGASGRAVELAKR